MSSILIATPCYGGQLHAQCALSIMELRLLLQSKGINSEWLPISGESLIPRARNACIAYLLSSTCTHIIFIDGDITFHPGSVIRLLEKDVPISACVYPKKEIDINTIVTTARENIHISPDLVTLSTMSYTYNTTTPIIEDGWMKVDEVGTGFLLIRRDLILNMIDKYPHLKYENDCLNYNRLHPNMYDHFYLLFDTRIIDGRYLSEDYSFCRYVREMGYDILVYTLGGLNHTGTYTYRGNLYLSLTSQL